MTLSYLHLRRHRERDGGAYGTNAYFVAVLLFDLVPMRMLPPTFFAMFSYWSIGLHTKCVACVLLFTGVHVQLGLRSKC